MTQLPTTWRTAVVVSNPKAGSRTLAAASTVVRGPTGAGHDHALAHSCPVGQAILESIAKARA